LAWIQQNYIRADTVTAAMGGEVAAHSSPGQGSSFEVRLKAEQ
jgi:signal transduction histidine kinase